MSHERQHDPLPHPSARLEPALASLPDPAPRWRRVNGSPLGPGAGTEPARILIVDDDEPVRTMLARLLRRNGYACLTAAGAGEAMTAIAEPGLTLVLLDLELPDSSGLQLLRQIKARDPGTEVVMVSGHGEVQLVRYCLREGAYDYLLKPIVPEELDRTVRLALERGLLVRQNCSYQRRLEAMVAAKTAQLESSRDVALLALAKLAESRDRSIGRHLQRIAELSRHLTRLLTWSPYGYRLGGCFEERIFRSSPLHDIGKVAIPDAILLKAGPLTAHERAIMETHTVIGGGVLRGVIEEAGANDFLTMAMGIAYQHHERWDGSGYPAGLSGERIALAARIVALADAYDALTSERPYKEALSHDTAVERLRADRGRHFDPVIADCFLAHHESFRRICRRLRD